MRKVESKNVFQNVTSYFAYGAMAVILSWAVSGCRLGNQTEENPPPPPLFTGYYVMEATGENALQYCKTDDQDQETCENKNPAQHLPEFVQVRVGNPVGLQIETQEGDAKIFYAFSPYETVPYLNTRISSIYADQPSASLSYNETPSSLTLWEDPNCTLDYRLETYGQVERTGGPNIAGLQTDGRIRLNISESFAFAVANPGAGDCTQTLQSMYECYLDAQLCPVPTEEHRGIVETIFTPFVAGTFIEASEIPNLRALSYSVQYQ